jgi:electron transfer flavoprotein beta subunit
LFKTIVCVKAVPDTSSPIRVRTDRLTLELEGIPWVMNPYDEYAVEEALRIKEREGSGQVIALSLGDARAKEVLRIALSMGVDEAVHISASTNDGMDSQSIARSLARVISDMQFDLILCGRQAVDWDSAQVPSALAEFLDLPHIGMVTKLKVDVVGRMVHALRQVEGGSEWVEAALPCVIGANKGLNEPRYPSLKGILAAKKKEIPEWGGGLPGNGAEKGELQASRLRILSLAPPPARQSGRVLQGEVSDRVRELVRLLREEAKVV